MSPLNDIALNEFIRVTIKMLLHIYLEIRVPHRSFLRIMSSS